MLRPFWDVSLWLISPIASGFNKAYSIYRKHPGWCKHPFMEELRGRGNFSEEGRGNAYFQGPSPLNLRRMRERTKANVSTREPVGHNRVFLFRSSDLTFGEISFRSMMGGHAAITQCDHADVKDGMMAKVLVEDNRDFLPCVSFSNDERFMIGFDGHP
ncbi:hypothetical protein VNO77_03041 [Canavalia gladiata]|uniref:Uncharacterized protein n=1 Tax=Canavalia gladiata TaxID=3824 RepID=A0AAN9MUQ0_CANGL